MRSCTSSSLKALRMPLTIADASRETSSALSGRRSHVAAVAAIFALVNTIIGTVIKIVAIPLYILTLGLISFVINGLLLWITAWVTSSWGWGLTVESFWLGVVAAILISLINWVFGILLRPQEKKRRG